MVNNKTIEKKCVVGYLIYLLNCIKKSQNLHNTCCAENTKTLKIYINNNNNCHFISTMIHLATPNIVTHKN